MLRRAYVVKPQFYSFLKKYAILKTLLFLFYTGGWSFEAMPCPWSSPSRLHRGVVEPPLPQSRRRSSNKHRQPTGAQDPVGTKQQESCSGNKWNVTYTAATIKDIWLMDKTIWVRNLKSFHALKVQLQSKFGGKNGKIHTKLLSTTYRIKWSKWGCVH